MHECCMKNKFVNNADQDADKEADQFFDQYAILCRPSQPSAQICAC